MRTLLRLLMCCIAAIALPLTLHAQPAQQSNAPSAQQRPAEAAPAQPSPTDKAAEAEKKKAEDAEKARQLSEAQDRAVQHYRQHMQAEGKTPPPPVPVNGAQDARAAADSRQKDPSPPTAHSTPQTSAMPPGQPATQGERTP